MTYLLLFLVSYTAIVITVGTVLHFKTIRFIKNDTQQRCLDLESEIQNFLCDMERE